MTTKFTIFSDFHSHNFAYGSERAEGTVCGKTGYYNSRFLQGLDVLGEITQASRGSNAVLFAGDLFHQRGSVSTDVLMGTYSALEHMAIYSQVHMIPGNHDYADRDGNIHSLLGIHQEGGNIKVYDRSWSTCEFPGVNVWFVPYQEHKDKFIHAFKEMQDHWNWILNKSILDSKNNFNLLILHSGIQGGVIGSDFVLSSSNDLALSELPEWMNLTLIGHFHKHQKLKENVYFIGSTHHHNWGDANDKRGFLTLTVNEDKTYDLEHTESTKASRFIVSDKPIKCRSIDFVKSTEESLSSKDFGSPKVFENIEVNVEEKTEDFVPPSWSVDDVLASWVLAKGVSDDYLEMGKKLIKEVM